MEGERRRQKKAPGTGGKERGTFIEEKGGQRFPALPLEARTWEVGWGDLCKRRIRDRPACDVRQINVITLGKVKNFHSPGRGGGVRPDMQVGVATECPH